MFNNDFFNTNSCNYLPMSLFSEDTIIQEVNSSATERLPLDSNRDDMDIEENPHENGISSLSDLLNKLIMAHSPSEREKIVERLSSVYKIPKELKYEINLKLFAMLFGDKIIGASSLEGHTVEKNVDFILKILSSNSVLEGFDKESIIHELKDLHFFAAKLSKMNSEDEAKNLAKNIKDKLSSLQPEGRLLFPGGWITRTGGHFILYEIFRRSDGLFDFNLYNTGAGTENHNDGYINEKKYVNPLFSVVDIPLERVSSSAFTQLIIALNSSKFSPRGKNESSADTIYSQLIRVLGTKYVIDNNAAWVTPQLSGTCSSKALIAFLKNRLPTDIFYELLYQIKFWCLANFINSKNDCSNLSESALIKKAAHGLANLGRKMYGKKILSNEKATPQDIERLLELSVICEKALVVANITSSLPAERTKQTKISTEYYLKPLDALISTFESTQEVDPSSSSSSSATSATEKNVKPKKIKERKYLNVKVPSFKLDGKILEHFLEWQKYFITSLKTEHDLIAFHNLEAMLDALPIEIDLSSISLKQKKQVFDSITKLSIQYYLNSKDSNHLRVNSNMWHMFYILTRLWRDLASHQLSHIDLDHFGFSFLVPNIAEARGFYCDLACSDLWAQEKNVQLRCMMNLSNSNKSNFFFDTLSKNYEKLDFEITKTNYKSYDDFIFINEFLQNSSNQSSKKDDLEFLNLLMKHYFKPQKEGLPKSYYDLRNVYLYCCLSNEFVIDRKTYPSSISVSIPKLKEDSSEENNLSDENSSDFTESYNVKFYPIKSHYPIGFSLGRVMSCYINWKPEAVSFFNLGHLNKKIIQKGGTQNNIRAVPKSACFPDEKLNFSQDDFLSISKYEINRISDIFYSDTDRLYLALNYYLENPLLLEKDSHLHFLGFIFYQFGTLSNNLKITPQLQNLFNVFFKKLLTVYESPEKNQYKILTFLFSLGFDYLYYNWDADLYHHLKSSVISQNTLINNQSSLNEIEKEFKSNLGNFVLRAYALAPTLSLDEASLALSIVLDLQECQNHSIWSKQTTPLINRLMGFLDDPSHRNYILNNVTSLAENLDTSLDLVWEIDVKNKFKFICQGWEYDLVEGNLNHSKNQKLKDVLRTNIGGNERLGYASIRQILQNTNYKLTLKDGAWSNAENTLRILKSNDTYKLNDTYGLHEFFLNQWQEFSFMSKGLYGKLLKLPHSFDAQYKDNSRINYDRENQISEKSILWYTPIDSKYQLFYGKNANNEILYQLEKSDSNWRLINLKTNLMYASLDNRALPHPLEPIEHFPLAMKKRMQLWVDRNKKSIVKIEFLFSSQSKQAMRIENKMGTFNLIGFDGLELFENTLPSPFNTLPPFLQLKQANGKKFFLIPETTFFVEKKGVAKDPFRLKHICSDEDILVDDSINPINDLKPASKATNNEPCFFLFEYDEKTQELYSSDLKAQIYLSYLYFVDQNYDKAFNALEKCRQKSPYTKEQQKMFSGFIVYYSQNRSKINNPIQHAILMRIHSFRLESKEFYSPDSIDDNEFITERTFFLFKDYIQFRDAIPASFKLTKKEELNFISALENRDKVCYENNKSFKDRIKNNSNFYNLIKINRGLNQPDVTTKSHDSIKIIDPYALSYIGESRKKSYGLLNGNTEGLDLTDFDYKKELSSIQNLPLDFFINRPLDNLNDKMIMALWMGLLSSNTEESAFATTKILFLKIKDENKRTFSSKKISFLNAALILSEDFKLFLSKQNFNIDWTAPGTQDHLNLIGQWKNFIDTEFDAVRNKVEKLNSTSIGGYRNRISHRGITSLNHTPSMALNKNLFPVYMNDLNAMCKKLEQERIYVLRRFLKTSQLQIENKFLTDYSQSPSAMAVLNGLPLAKELYEAYSDTIELTSQEWGLINLQNKPTSSILESFQNEVQRRKSDLIQDSTKLKKMIEKMANATPWDYREGLTLKELQESVENKIDIFSYQKSPITMQELACYILENNLSTVKERNPFISDQDIKTLFSDVCEWMLLESEIEICSKTEQEMQELLRNIHDIPGFDVTPLLQHIGSLLQAVRHYTVTDNTQLLAFEYLAKLVLRKQQVEKIQGSIASPQSHQLLKLMMGEGKTKVVLPLISKIIAAKGQLPIILAPYALYEEYLKNLKLVSQDQLKQNVFTFCFNRSSSTAIDDTNLILRMLEKAIEEKGLVLITTETIRALFLKYQELLILEEQFVLKSKKAAGDITERRIKLGSIINLIRRNSFALMDEGHLALKSLTEMNFTLEGDDPLNEQDITLLLKIFRTLISMNFDLSKSLDLSVTSEENDSFSLVRDALIDRLYPNSNHADIRNYLKGNNKEYYEQVLQVNKGLAHELALVKEEIWKLLPFTLSKSLNHRYGRNLNSPEVEYAIPYLGAQKPSPLSEFGHKFVMLNYTIQMHIQEGLKKHQFKKWIQNLKKRWIDLTVKTSEQEANQFLQRYIGNYSLKQVNLDEESVLNGLYDIFGKNQEVIFDYLETSLLPSLKFNNKKLNSNEQDLGNFLFPQILALSGTPYNFRTYPAPFQLDSNKVYEINDEEDEIFKTKTNAIQLTDEEKKLMHALSKPINLSYATVSEESFESALLAIRSVYEDQKNLCAFIDLGAYFKNKSNLQVAKLILESLREIEGVVFFDDVDNKLSCIKRGKDTPETYIHGKIPLNKLFAFFDNIHTFAADISLHENAHAIVSFNQESCLYELLQATKRMRKLEKSQSVSYLISKSIKGRIKELIAPIKFDVSALYLYAIINEAKVLGKEIEMSTLHQLKHEIKKSYIQKQLESKENLSSSAKMLIENNDCVPSGYFSEKITPKNYFLGYCKYLKSNLNLLKSSTQGWNSIIERTHKLLPSMIDSEGTGDLNREIEKQEERKVEVFVDNSNAFEPAKEEAPFFDILLHPPIAYDIVSTLNNSVSKFLTTYVLNDFVSLIENKPVGIFDSSIFLTKSFAKTAQVSMPNWEIPLKPVDYFVQLIYPIGNNQFSCYYLIITLKEKERLKSLLQNLNSLPQGSLACYMSLFSIQGDLIAGHNVIDTNGFEFKRALIQLKFFDSREVYSKYDESYLRQWIQGKEQGISDLFAKLHQNRQKTDDFGNGNLFKIINESLEIQRNQLTAHIQTQQPITPVSNGSAMKRPHQAPTQEDDGGMDVDTEIYEPKKKRLKT